MKKTVCIFMAILLSASLYAQVAKVNFLDGTKGFAIGSKLRMVDTLTFESEDQMLWQQVIKSSNSSLISKQGVLQQIAYPNQNQNASAKVTFLDGSLADMIEDPSLKLFSVGDTIKMIKKKFPDGDEVCRIYFGKLPGNITPEGKIETVIIKKIKY